MYNVPAEPAPQVAQVSAKWVIKVEPAHELDWSKITIYRNNFVELVMEAPSNPKSTLHALINNHLRSMNPRPYDLIEVPVSLYLPRA